jgi:GTPase
MPAPKERTNIKLQSERAILAAVRLPDSIYDERDPFGELAALADQAGATVVGTLEQRLDKPVAGTYMGTGKIKELAELAKELNATTVIFDHELSPRQIANIEEVVSTKIVDRSELILDIFASRATTVEAKLQVELAQLEYTYPRLRAMWSHLERIVGAGGITGIGTRGPGEQQLEIDRRLAQKKRIALQTRLADIQDRRRREVQTRNLDHFTVGIVGYTNAGKSTLFNTLTPGGAYADDRLFATLTTRTREWSLTGGLRVLLSDTVGFVRALPHNLVASFRATLEEATHAHVLLVVLDVSDQAAELHFSTVMKTLDEIFKEVIDAEKRAGIMPGDEGAFKEPLRVLLLNKVDKLRDNKELLVWQNKIPGCIPIIAKNAKHPGHAELETLIRSMATGGERKLAITVPLQDSRTINTLERKGTVESRQYTQSHVTLTLTIGTRQLDQLRSQGAQMTVQEPLSSSAPKGKPKSKPKLRPVKSDKAAKPSSTRAAKPKSATKPRTNPSAKTPK